MTTALAGTVGTGNIAGVTGAIFIGGPGSVFWMWVSAFFGMCTKYAEIALAMKFRNTDRNGVHKGGPCTTLKRPGQGLEMAGRHLRHPGRTGLLWYRQHDTGT